MCVVVDPSLFPLSDSAKLRRGVALPGVEWRRFGEYKVANAETTVSLAFAPLLSVKDLED